MSDILLIFPRPSATSPQKNPAISIFYPGEAATAAGFDVDYWDNYFYKIALTKAKNHCEHEGVLRELNKEITKRMKKEFKKIGLDLKKLK